MTTKSSESENQKSKHQKMARCSSKGDAAPVNPLSANADTFIRLFDERQRKIKESLNFARFNCNKVEQVHCLIGGFIFGGLLVSLVVCSSVFSFVMENYLKMLLTLCIIPIGAVACVIFFINLYKSLVEDMHSYMRDFRKTVFSLIVELGKLMQRCEDVQGSLSGSDKENMRRLATSVQELLKLMESLSETVTIFSVGKVYDEYMKVSTEFEKMKVRLSFYSGAKSQ